MARLRIPPWLQQLKTALLDDLSEVGIPASVSHEAIPGTQLQRVYVIAERFKPLQHSERQSLVWRIANRALSPQDQLRISMFLTLTPDEAADVPPSYGAPAVLRKAR